MKSLSRTLAFVPALGLALAAACASPSGGGGDVRGGSSGGDVGALYAGDADVIPCAPRAVLETICQQCHTRPMKNGAPFPLQGRSDVLRTYGGVVIRELMIEQLEAKQMPLSPVTIEDEQRTTLITWLRAGAPAVPAQSCLPDAGPGADASTTQAQDASGSADAGEPDAGSDDDGGTDDMDSGL